MKIVAPGVFRHQPKRMRRAGADVSSLIIGDTEYLADKPKSGPSTFVLHVLPRLAGYGLTYAKAGGKGVIALAALDAGIATFYGLSRLAAKGGPMINAFHSAKRVCGRAVFAGLTAATLFVGAIYGIPAAQNAWFNAHNGMPYADSFTQEIAQKMIAKGEVKLGSAAKITNGTDVKTCRNIDYSKLWDTDKWQLSCEIKDSQAFGGKRTVYSQPIPGREIYLDKRNENLVGKPDFFHQLNAQGLKLEERIQLPAPQRKTTAEEAAKKQKARLVAQQIGLNS